VTSSVVGKLGTAIEKRLALMSCTQSWIKPVRSASLPLELKVDRASGEQPDELRAVIRRDHVVPLIVIVLLSFSVFWMDRSSLGDRINVSFIGILTGVAYQIVVSDLVPRISYSTLIHGFLNLSFILMCATVAINLIVGSLDQKGKSELGNRIDRRCRWIFPLVYFSLNGLMVGAAFLFY